MAWCLMKLRGNFNFYIQTYYICILLRVRGSVMNNNGFWTA
jgi:hypothetical protein